MVRAGGSDWRVWLKYSPDMLRCKRDFGRLHNLKKRKKKEEKTGENRKDDKLGNRKD